MKLRNRKGDKVGIACTCKLMDHPSEIWRNTSIATTTKKIWAAHTLAKYADLNNEYLINFLLFFNYVYAFFACMYMWVPMKAGGVIFPWS